MRIIGRKEEIEQLEYCEGSDHSELVCVYGRRRVGKTFLIEETFAHELAFRATGVESGSMRVQLKSFFQRLKEHGDPVKTIPRDWFEAFSRLESVLQMEKARRTVHGKRIIFLDEFPWFATPKSDFIAAFGEFWNRCGTAQARYLCIICGSATSWIIKNIIDNTGSLYNRVTCQIFLRPFTLHETEEYARDRDFDWTRRQIAEYQMIFGGLPYFLVLMNKNESLAWNVDRLCFQPQALLRNESKRLLEATLRRSPVYENLLRMLSMHKYGMRKEACYESLGIARGTFQRAVDDLEKCGYIIEYKEHHAPYNPYRLQLADPFLLFHFYFFDNDHKKDYKSFSDFSGEEGLYMNWRGNAFEVLCLYHTEQLKKALGIAGVRSENFPWVSESRKDGAQIDLVIERDDGITNLCEMKYTDEPFAISAEYEKALLNKRKVYRDEADKKHALKITMVCAEGISGTAHTEHIAKTLTLDDLFEA